jgi:hypothetical protein
VTDPHDREVLPADCHRQIAKPLPGGDKGSALAGTHRHVSPWLLTDRTKAEQQLIVRLVGLHTDVKDIVTKADLKDIQGDVDRSPLLWYCNKLWQRFKGMWKDRTPDPVEELEKMRKESDRELPRAR